jgi:hypothetical protein
MHGKSAYLCTPGHFVQGGRTVAIVADKVTGALGTEICREHFGTYPGTTNNTPEKVFT